MLRLLRAYREARRRLNAEPPLRPGGVARPAGPAANLKLPAEIWARVIAFLATRHDGDVILTVRDGRIVGAKIIEYVEMKGPDRE